MLFLSIILTLTSVVTTTCWAFDNQNVRLDIETNGRFQLASLSNDVKLRGTLKLQEDEELKVAECLQGEGICVSHKNVIKARVERSSEYCDSFEFINDGILCIDYEDSQWFGGAERYVQKWPVQFNEIDNEPFVTREKNAQAVLEPYWINSKGGSIYVSEDTPLFTDSNTMQQNSLCLYANDSDPYLPRKSVSLKFEVCGFDNALMAHQYGIKNFLGKAVDYLDTRMTRWPIYSTWVRYKRDINESVLLNFAQEIVDHGYPNSQFEIDDRWEICYGSLEVDTKTFPDLASVTKTLKEMGFRITFWVHPFVNFECEPYFSTYFAEGRLVLNQDGKPDTTWWNGKGGHVDFSNSTTAQWFVDRLKNTMSGAGIDSIKLDAGETSFMPQMPQLIVADETLYPDDFIRSYVDMAKNFGDLLEVRVGRRTQDRSVFIRMIDKDSRWGFDNGLKTLITTMFQMNLAGYSYVLPDMIGGNAYAQDTATKELFIRWLQVNILMPALQFSIVPWDYDDETVLISSDMLNLRDKYFPYLDAALRYHVATGDPVNPPIWYLDPTDENALKCSDEYLVGDRLLVAPVIEEGARSRDIYLPEGYWQDVEKGGSELIQGKTWLRNYTVGLNQVPIFENLKSKKLTKELVKLSEYRINSES